MKQLSSVDLPAPFGPMMAWVVPSSTCEVDVVQRVQPAEALVDVGDMQDDIALLLVIVLLRRLVDGWALAGVAPRATTGAGCAATPSMIPPGRNITTSMKITPERQLPAVADELAGSTATTKLSSAVGQEAKKRCRIASLNAEKMFSKYLISQAPITGPTSVPTPPRMVISTTSPEAVHCMRSAPASGSVTASSAAGEARIHAGDHEGGERVGPRVEAGVVDPRLVGLDAAQHHAEGRAEDLLREIEGDDQQHARRSRSRRSRCRVDAEQVLGARQARLSGAR